MSHFNLKREGFTKFFQDLDRDLIALQERAHAYQRECVDAITLAETEPARCRECNALLTEAERRDGGDMCSACIAEHSDVQVDQTEANGR